MNYENKKPLYMKLSTSIKTKAQERYKKHTSILYIDLDGHSSETLSGYITRLQQARDSLNTILKRKNQTYNSLIWHLVMYLSVSVGVLAFSKYLISDPKLIEFLRFCAYGLVVVTAIWFARRITFKRAYLYLQVDHDILKKIACRQEEILKYKEELISGYFSHEEWIKIFVEQINTYNPEIPEGVGKDLAAIIEKNYKHAVRNPVSIEKLGQKKTNNSYGFVGIFFISDRSVA